MGKVTRQDFLSRWFSDCEGTIEIRVLPSGVQGFFKIGDWESVDTFISQHKGKDIYFGVAARDGKGGAKENVIDVPGVWIDLDFKTIPEEQARKLLKECPLKPAFGICSGGGYHVYWKFVEPSRDIETVERINRQLAQHFGSDPVHNADRILRMPGTFNYKYKPERPVKIVSFRNNQYDLIDFDELPPLKTVSNRGGSVNPPGWEREVKKGTTPGNRHRDGSMLIGKWIRMGLDDEDILTLMEKWDENNIVSLKQDYGENELAKIIASIRKTDQRTYPERNVSGEISEWLEAAGDEFSIDHLIKDLGLLDDITDPKKRRGVRQNVSNFLNRAKEKGELESQKKHGWFRKVMEEEVMDVVNVDPSLVPIALPLKLSPMTNICPGSLIIFAGAKNAGKTAVLLNVAKDNLSTYGKDEIVYINSELNPNMANRRIKLFSNIDIREWNNIKWVKCETHWEDIIRKNDPQPGKLFIVDYVEEYAEPFKMASHLNQIYKALNGAVGVVAIQKNFGRSMGYGGDRTQDKALLYVALDRGLATILTLKDWSTSFNPNGCQLQFKIGGGAHIQPMGEWREPEDTK